MTSQTAEQDWGRVFGAFRNDTTVDGCIVKQIRGGFRVDVGCVRVFLPKSHIDWDPSEDIVGSQRAFGIIKLALNRSIVLTARPVSAQRGIPTEVWHDLIDAYRTKRPVLGTVLDTGRDVLLNICGVEATLYQTELVEPERFSEIEAGDEFEVLIIAITDDGSIEASEVRLRE